MTSLNWRGLSLDTADAETRLATEKRRVAKAIGLEVACAGAIFYLATTASRSEGKASKN